MTDYSHIKAVVFDAVGTVMYPCPSVADAYQSALRRHCGTDVDTETVSQALRESLQNRSGGTDLRTSEQAEHQFWADLVHQLCPNSAGFEACFEDLFDHFARAENWRCFPDVEETLQALAERRIVVAVASNFDRRLNSVCDGLAELSQVDRRIISSVVGWRKPADEFFHAVSAELGISADAILMVGDDVTNDIQGALSVGMPAALISRSQPPPDCPDGAVIMTSLTQLLPILDGRLTGTKEAH